MEAVRPWTAALTLLLTVVSLAASAHAQGFPGPGFNSRTENFLVHAPTKQLADLVAHNAEKFRNELAEYWLGKRLPKWPTPCPIEVVAGPNLAAQGATTYNRSPVGNFQMRVVGTPERILDSVLPHEVTHTVMATHFGRPLPRWADEGICTTVEHSAERDKHEIKLREYLSTDRGIRMNELFLLREYPNDILPMYAQGYSVCRFLIQQSGPRQFIGFLEDYMRDPHDPSWTANIRAHYGYDSLKQLQDKWLAWVAQGSGPVESFVSTRARSNGSSPSGMVLNGPTGLLASNAAGAASGRTAGASSPVNHLGPQRSDSWYQRRHDQIAQQDPIPAGNQTALGQLASGSTARPSASAPSTSFGPQSVISSGHYSVAQPRSEEDFGQAVPTASAARSTRTYR